MSLQESFKNLSITTQFVTWILLITIVPMSIIIYITLVESQETLESQRLETLRGIADSKANQIQNYFFEREREVTLLANSQEVIDAMVRLDRVFDAGINSPEYLAVDSEFRPFLSYVQETPEYYDVLLLSTRGDIIFTVIHESDFGTNVITGPYKNTEIARIFDRVQGLLHSDISDFEYYEPSGIPAAFVAAPIFKDRAFVGIIVLQFSNQKVFDVVHDYSGLGKTGETMLGTVVGDGVVFISPLRFDTGAAFERKVVLGSNEALPMQAATQGERGVGIAIDYRGEEVLAAWSYLAPLRWGMVTKIDSAEVYAPAHRLIKFALFVDVILYLLVFVLSVILARSITKPIKSLMHSADRIAKGDLDTKITIGSEDEIGQLGKAFNLMTNKLKESYSRLEEKIKERTASLEKEKNQTETLLASIGDAVFAIDKEQNIVFLNPRAEELSGYKLLDIQGKPYYEYLKFVKEKDNSENLDFIRTALRGETTTMKDRTQLIGKGGRKLPVADTATPLKDKEGNITGAIVVFRDATKERELEVARAELVSFASHQLKAPLAYIGWNIETLKESKSKSESKKIVDEIDKSIEEMKKLVGDVLNISQIEQGSVEFKLKPTQLEDIVEDILKESSSAVKKRNITIVFTKSAQPLPDLNIDPQYTHEIFKNIISNAIKYTKDKITMSFEKKGDSILFTCSDNGIGIPKGEQSKIFSKFYVASNVGKAGLAGTGIGLRIAKALVERMHGKIWFESEEDKGTTFYLNLTSSS